MRLMKIIIKKQLKEYIRGFKEEFMDVKKLQENISKEINKNIKLCLIDGKHDFVPIEHGSTDVVCTRCGIKAMRMIVRK